MTEFLLRFGEPTDAPALSKYEQAYFPAVPGQYHAGYLYENTQLARLTLTEELAAPRRSFTIVAESEKRIIGFAAAAPWLWPGSQRLDPASMLLQYLVVEPKHRRSGIARRLVAEVEKRALAARQNIVVAHIPSDQSDFYHATNWEVKPDGTGYAWLPFGSSLSADIADPEVGFPLMAAKVLRPKAIRRTFEFGILSGRPLFDAAAHLMHLIDTGDVEYHDLDRETRAMVDQARQGPPSEEMFDLLKLPRSTVR